MCEWRERKLLHSDSPPAASDGRSPYPSRFARICSAFGLLRGINQFVSIWKSSSSLPQESAAWSFQDCARIVIYRTLTVATSSLFARLCSSRVLSSHFTHFVIVKSKYYVSINYRLRYRRNCADY